jgi:hypothetical protein
MIKPIAVATMIIVAGAMTARAQGGNPSPAPPAQGQPVLGQTGTMYGGNNAQLQLPPERNVWYEDRWAGYQPQVQSAWYFGAGDLSYAGRWIGYEPKGPAGAAAGGG